MAILRLFVTQSHLIDVSVTQSHLLSLTEVTKSLAEYPLRRSNSE